MTSMVSVLSVGMTFILSLASIMSPDANALVPVALCFVMISLLAGLISKQNATIARLEKLIDKR